MTHSKFRQSKLISIESFEINQALNGSIILMKSVSDLIICENPANNQENHSKYNAPKRRPSQYSENNDSTVKCGILHSARMALAI